MHVACKFARIEPYMKIFLFIDALGWDLVGESGYLADILPHRREVETHFGYSFSAIPTILSGRRPSEHRHLGLFAYAPDRSPFKRVAAFMRMLRPRSLWNRGRVRGWLSRFVKRVLGFTGYFQLYQVSAERLPYMDYCERRDLFVPGGMGPVANIADVLKKSGASYHISNWRLSDAENLSIGEDKIRAGVDFIFLYTAELDAVRHDNAGPGHEARARVEAKLAWYRLRIERLIAEAKASGKPWSLTVFSDHGMTPLTKTVDLKSAVESTGLVFGVDYGACFDSTLLRLTYLRPGAKERIDSALAPFAGDGRWLGEEEQRANGIWRDDRSFGDAIFLVNPGVQIVPSDMGLKPLAGMHGFDPRDAHSKAAVMSTDPIPEWVSGVWDYFALMKSAVAENGGL